MLTLLHIDLELVVLQFSYLKFFSSYCCSLWLLRKIQGSLEKSKSQIYLYKWKNTNLWFAFLLCLLSPLQEAHRPSINILLIRSSRRTWSNGQSCCKPDCRIKSGMNRLYLHHSQYLIFFSKWFMNYKTNFC